MAPVWPWGVWLHVAFWNTNSLWHRAMPQVLSLSLEIKYAMLVLSKHCANSRGESYVHKMASAQIMKKKNTTLSLSVSLTRLWHNEDLSFLSCVSQYTYFAVFKMQTDCLSCCCLLGFCSFAHWFIALLHFVDLGATQTFCLPCDLFFVFSPPAAAWSLIEFNVVNRKSSVLICFCFYFLSEGSGVHDCQDHDAE